MPSPRLPAGWTRSGCAGATSESNSVPAPLGRFVGSLSPADLRCPVLMAGQVLEHLTDHAEPTRSEVCHLYDLLARDYAGIVLSDETAIGENPARAVGQAAALVRAFRGASRE